MKHQALAPVSWLNAFRSGCDPAAVARSWKAADVIREDVPRPKALA